MESKNFILSRLLLIDVIGFILYSILEYTIYSDFSIYLDKKVL